MKNKTLEQEIVERVDYVFRNALISYGRQSGFKKPIESADKEIGEFVTFLTTALKRVRESERERIINIVKTAKDPFMLLETEQRFILTIRQKE